jgi:hypothetical protein
MKPEHDDICKVLTFAMWKRYEMTTPDTSYRMAKFMVEFVESQGYEIVKANG